MKFYKNPLGSFKDLSKHARDRQREATFVYTMLWFKSVKVFYNAPGSPYKLFVLYPDFHKCKLIYL
jgi:hypothetical protein